MNSTQFIGKGYQKIDELKKLFLLLTDSDLMLLENKQDEILHRLHEKSYKAREEKNNFVKVGQ